MSAPWMIRLNSLLVASRAIWHKMTGTMPEPRVAEPTEAAREEKPFALFDRLQKESSALKGDVRQLTTDDFNSDELINEIVCLMFNLSPPQQRGGMRAFTDSQGKLENALAEARKRGTTLKLFRSVFYIYVAEEFHECPTYEELIDSLYRRLHQLSVPQGPIRTFINLRFAAGWAKAHPDTPATFDHENESHRDALRYFFPCHISVHRKKFPPRQEAVVFLVGRSGLHDLKEIEGHEDALKRKLASGREFNASDSIEGAATPTESEARALHALTVKGDGEYQGAQLRFTAHSFTPFSPVTRREKEIYIGTTRSDWTLSIGSAEHDEIQCSELHDVASKISLNNVELDKKNRRWNLNCVPAKDLPPWLLGPTNDKLVPEGKTDGIKVLVEKAPSLGVSLRRLITRSGFPPHIILEGRALPLEGGQLKELQNTTDNLLARIVESLKPKAAIHIYRDIFWLIRASDGTIRAVTKTQGGWSQAEVSKPEIGPIEKINYVWVEAARGSLPPGYCGMLKIYPPDNMKERVKLDLAIDPQAGALPLSYMSFDETLHPDTLLGRQGVLALKSDEAVGGRPAYALLPIGNSLYPYVAFKPPLSLNGGPNGWQIYDPQNQKGDLRIEKGEFIYKSSGVKVMVVGSENTLVCGTSVFQVKTSGTPHAGMWAYSITEEEEDEAAEPKRIEFDPKDLEAVKMALITTGWSAYNIHEISASNVAVHYGLSNNAGDSRFLKAYYPKNADNAAREEAFYERFREQAADIFIVPPEEVLRSDAGDRVWGMVFPRLRPLSQEIKVATLPQAVAIGYATARLLRALDEAKLINYDIDASMLCLDNGGRLVVVDFDNVFPLFDSNPSEAQLTAYRHVLATGVLPSKISVLPPEAQAFANSDQGFPRQQALAQIGSAFATYLLAVMLLTLLGPKLSPSGAFTLDVDDGAETDVVKVFEALLKRMLSPEVWLRPSPREVEDELARVASSLAASDPRFKDEAARLGVVLSAG